MRSFNLSIFATVGGAVFAAAVPINVVSGVKVSPGSTSTSTSSDSTNGPDLSTVPAILTHANGQLAPIQQQLQSLVGVQNVDALTVVQPKLDQVKAILANTVTQVQAISSNPSAGALTVAGQALSLADVSKLSYTFISSTATIMSLSQKVVGVNNLPAIQSTVTTTSGLLATVLRIALPLVSGLLIGLGPLLAPLVPLLEGLGLIDVLSILNL